MIHSAIRTRYTCHALAVFASLIAALVAPLRVRAANEAAPRSSSTPAIAAVGVGIKGYFKAGCWIPVGVVVSGVDALANPRIEVTVPDSDGVPTTVRANLSTTPSYKGFRSVIAYTKVGRVGSTIQVTLFDGDRRIASENIRPNAAADARSPSIPLSPTSELVISLAEAPLKIERPFSSRESDASQTQQLVELNQVAELPVDWFGYGSVDVVMISAGDVKLCRELASDAARRSALSRWVKLGGRLVVFSGGQAAEQLFKTGAPLAEFAPGKFTQAVPLKETGPLENFAGGNQIAPTNPLPVPQFSDVTGNIEVYAGRRPSDLPLVVRSPHGLGEIAFVAVDLHQAPLADWSGRTGFLQAVLRPYVANAESSAGTQRLVTRGYNDLAGALRQRLGQSFTSVVPIGFAIVAALAVAYMAFLGPFDYLLVNRWVRRPWVAWITFPLLVLLFCGGAMSLSHWRVGQAGLRVNQMELIDVDLNTKHARGIFWASLYSPAAAQFDLGVQNPTYAHISGEKPETLFSWWGLPGVGIGGMQSGGDLGIVRTGYSYGPDWNALNGVPLLASATKSFMARWSAPSEPMIEAKLTDQDGLAVGSITNQSGPPLRNARLLFGTWAYRLPILNPGQTIEVGEQLNPRKIKTIVTHDALDGPGAAGTSGDARVFVAEHASAKEILSLMMFYNAAGGAGFAHLPNRYQWYCDMSRLLELGRAVVVGEAAGSVTQLTENATGKAIAGSNDQSTVIYRFVIPVTQHNTP